MNNATPHVPVTATVEKIRTLNEDTSLFTLRLTASHPLATGFLPGQFVQLSLPGVGEIPVSYCGYPGTDNRVELCIRHVGRVTLALKVISAGAVVGVRGPFGTGFPLHSYDGKDLLLVAGGGGMAPLRSLLLALVANREHYGRIALLLGARTSQGLLFFDELAALQAVGSIALSVAVEQEGEAGRAFPVAIGRLPLLFNDLTIADPLHTCAAVCGPPACYPDVIACLRQCGLPDGVLHLSLERRMKCGVGRCGHCAVGTNLCCVDGPVFSLAGLAGVEGALS